MHIFLMYMNWLSVLAFNIVTQNTLQETEEIRMPPVTSFYDKSPLADSTATILRLDRLKCLFFVILRRKKSLR